MANGYHHYLSHGAREHRIGHRFFNPAFYRAQLDPQAASETEAANPFLHYLRYLAAGRPEPRTTLYFDPAWYLRTYPQVADAVAAGTWRCALHHYLANDTPTAFDPLPDFAESYYLARHADVAAAVQNGEVRNGYAHFLANGASECRSPARTIDLGYYAALPEVQAALRSGQTADPFTHYLATGRVRGLPAVPPTDETVTEDQAMSLLLRKASGLLPLFVRRPMDFTCRGTPAVGIIMVLRDRFELTLMALASLHSQDAGDAELILNRFGFGGRNTLHRVLCARGEAFPLRQQRRIGPRLQCRSGARLGRCGVVPGQRRGACTRRGDASFAAPPLGSRHRRGWREGDSAPDGLLHEAGSIVWRDGATTGYLRGASPLAPEANFVREVDFCSGAFLMVRRSVLDAIGGFDEAFAPACYDDADLCLRIAAAGARAVYDPSVVIHQNEYGSARDAPASKAAIERNRLIFQHKHQDLLTGRPSPDSRTEVFARFAEPRRKRVLFVEHNVPLRMIGSGFVRSNDIVRVMASLGWVVTVFPIYAASFDVAAVYRDMPDTAEVMYDRTIADLPEFLAERQDYFDAIWIARTYILDEVRAAIEAVTTAAKRRPRIILDTEAIASERTAMLADLAKPPAPFDLQSALRQEFFNASFCDRVVAVSEHDAFVLRDLGLPRVGVIGHLRAVKPTPRSFTERAGLLFVGAIHERNSPNYDGLCWFIERVLPLIERTLKWETRLTVAGYTGETVSLDRFRNNSRVTLLGPVANTGSFYDRHRLFVAPTRYAAGTPYKIHEAASFGLPAVATDLLCRQMGWEDGVELLAAGCTDPACFAECVIRLYRDPDLWRRLRDNAMRRLDVENGGDRYARAIHDTLEV